MREYFANCIRQFQVDQGESCMTQFGIAIGSKVKTETHWWNLDGLSQTFRFLLLVPWQFFKKKALLVSSFVYFPLIGQTY